MSLLRIITIITYYYVFETGQLADDHSRIDRIKTCDSGPATASLTYSVTAVTRSLSCCGSRLQDHKQAFLTFVKYIMLWAHASSLVLLYHNIQSHKNNMSKVSRAKLEKRHQRHAWHLRQRQQGVKDDWDVHLQLAVFAINSVSTG